MDNGTKLNEILEEKGERPIWVRKRQEKVCSALNLRRLRAGLSRAARKGGSRGPARCGGDLGSPRKAAGPAAAHRGLPTKARNPPKFCPKSVPTTFSAIF
jgi:hypothetical protein